MHNYITKKIRELLIGNLRFLIQNLLNRLFWYTDIKDSCLFVAETVENLDLSILGKTEGLATVFPCLDTFENQERKSLKVACRELYFRRYRQES